MTAFHEVASALTALEKRAQAEAEQARAVTASTDAVQSATRRYRGGLASYYEVLEAQQLLLPAETQLAQVRATRLSTYVQLSKVLGGGWTLTAAQWNGLQAQNQEQEGDAMQWRQWFVRRIGVLLGMVVVLAGCTYDAAIQRLPPAEQAAFALYRHVMTASEVHTYVAQPTAAARTAYLQKLGLVQRFQALAPLDQEAIRSGLPRVGMSADALLFLWGEPYNTAGDARRYAHWYYLGSSFAQSSSGYHPLDFGNRVVVYFVGGKVEGWVDVSPGGGIGTGGGSSGN